MFNVEKYIKATHLCSECDNDGKTVSYINVNIDDDKIYKELEELRESLWNLHKILGYDFTLTVTENDIIFEELK